ncbi:E3 ubiquitin-protein ligase At1g63170-like [Diospyros lotus]|uniref:E3 ubiquitin-protein ligase At1g63170-like n=1 Tax=Diospyros lotus TaxID=55363 RepID=UPI0022566F5D|nr:E3 ubiquitin-protein ligase At1g63170-like [Diospyros lotus]
MNSSYFFVADSACNSGTAVSYSAVSASGEDDQAGMAVRNRFSRVPSSSFLARTAVRVSRARWFSFLRRVFHYQNGSRSDLGSNPFNAGSWMAMELTALLVQIVMVTYTLAVSGGERPVWPMRVWLSGYDLGSVLNLVVLFWRYWVFHVNARDSLGHLDAEQQRTNEEPRNLHFMNKFRTYLELFFAIWFVMGNVWLFDSRSGSFRRAPKLYLLCISLLAWNAVCYSFPFLLFVFLCCLVPLVSSLLGYNMNMASVHRGDSDDQISSLPSWKYTDFDTSSELGKSVQNHENPECCICLSKYREKEEMRQLPCSHIFHLQCVDQWLRIISCCPLCKQQLEER